MPAAKDCHTCTSYYEKLYKDRYGEKPVVNRNTARWNFDSILTGMSLAETKQLLDYYLQTMPDAHGHALQWFFNNYDKLIVAQREHVKEAERKQRLLRESEERAREWRARRDKQRTTND